MKRWIILFVSILTTIAHGGVTVTEQPTGTRWPLSGAVIDTAGGHAPAEFASGVAMPRGESLSQTFTVKESFTLSRIDVVYSTSMETGTVGLRLQEADVQPNEDQSAYTYPEGPSLFSTADLSFTFQARQAGPGVLSLTFTDDDRVRLEAGKTYAVEFVDSGTRGLILRRRGASTAEDAMAFASRVSINGNDTRDFAMRMFSVEQPGSDSPETADVPAAAQTYPDFAPQAGAPAAPGPARTAPKPQPMPDGKGYIVRLDDFANDPAEWKFFNGREFPGATGELTVVDDAADGQSAIRLAGDFTQGGMYVAATKALTMPAEHDLVRIRMRVKTSDVQHITVRFGDGTGQIHQKRNVPLTADGQWHDLVLEVDDIVGGEHWGGANNGKWNGPAKLLSINMVKAADGDDQQLEMLMADIHAEAIDALVVEGNDTAEVAILPADPHHSVSQADYGFALTYRWEGQGMQRDYKVFMHIVDADGKTVYDDDHFPPTPTSQWNGTVEYSRDVCLPRWVPRGKQTHDALAEGEYKLYAGLYNSVGRKPLQAGEGVSAADARRYLIGTLTIDNSAPIPPLPEKTLDLAGYKLTFSDEFDEPISVSAWGPIGEGGSKWIAHTPFKGDFGDARFTDPVEGFPFTVDDGVLRIEMRKGETRWQSGLISSMDPQGNGFKQQYGYFEMRAKFPATPGTWPGFWLHDSRRVTDVENKEWLNIEIDIVEQYGHWPNKLSTALHVWDRANKGRGSHVGVRHLVPGMTEDFHTYGAMVTEEFIIFYYDGIEIRRESTPESGHTPLYVMAELAAGPGWPLDRTPSPSYMEIDYIRVYAKE